MFYGIKTIMANAEIIIQPVRNANNPTLQGVALESFTLSSLEEVLSTVQNIAEYNDRTTVLDGGIALYPVEAYALREYLMHSLSGMKASGEPLGILPLAPARQIANYVLLLQATERNRRLFEANLQRGWSHWLPRHQPGAVTADPSSVAPLRFRKRRRVAQEQAKQQAANMAWLKEEETYKAKLTEAHLTAERAFEASAKIIALLGP